MKVVNRSLIAHCSTLSANIKTYMSISCSPAKIVKHWRFLNQHIKNGSFSSDYGVHASVLRKPEIIAKHPPAWSRFNNPAERRCGGAYLEPTEGAINGAPTGLRIVL